MSWPQPDKPRDVMEMVQDIAAAWDRELWLIPEGIILPKQLWRRALAEATRNKPNCETEKALCEKLCAFTPYGRIWITEGEK